MDGIIQLVLFGIVMFIRYVAHEATGKVFQVNIIELGIIATRYVALIMAASIVAT